MIFTWGCGKGHGQLQSAAFHPQTKSPPSSGAFPDPLFEKTLGLNVRELHQLDFSNSFVANEQFSSTHHVHNTT